MNRSTVLLLTAMLGLPVMLTGCAGIFPDGCSHGPVTYEQYERMYRVNEIKNSKSENLSNVNHSTQNSKSIQIGKATLTARSGNNRIANLSLACSAINNHIVNPGETFSFNKIVGMRTLERGYKEATIIVNKEHVKGLGGGVCQVSSALYNAIRNDPNIVIVERHSHSVPVAYTKYDATVSYGAKDFRFRNGYNRPIKIMASSRGGSVTVKVITF